MSNSFWLIAALVFGGLGVVFLTIAIALAVWWWKHPLEDKTAVELAGLKTEVKSIREDIQSLTKEIRGLVKEIREHFKGGGR